MFEHLLQAEADLFLDATPIKDASLSALLTAQVNTAKEDKSTEEWLRSIGATDASIADKNAAQHAFGVLATHTDEDEKKKAALTLRAPAAVQHLTSMLSAYDWEFVQQAHELRGYAVAKIVEETKHPDAKVRLQALSLLGKVTEVALFTERSEVRHVNMTDEELEAKLKEKLARFGGVVDVEMVELVKSTEPNDA